MRTTLPNSVVRTVRWLGQAVIVDVAGDVDFTSSRVLEESLLSILQDKPQRIVVNLAGVPFMNTAGVATLVVLLKRAHKIGASVCLVALPACVLKILRICRLETIFEIKDTVAEALNEGLKKGVASATLV